MLSIIIVNYNQKDKADTCLKTIFQYPPTIDFEIILIDNASTDQSLVYLQERWGNKSNFTFVANKQNIGFGRACNLGMRQAKGDLIALINPDIEVKPNTFGTLISHLQAHPKVGIVGPQLVFEDGTVQDSYRKFPNILDIFIKRTFLKKFGVFKKRLRRYLMWDKDKNKTEAVDWLVGAFWLLPKKVAEEVGLFDERFFLFFEDVDFCRRLAQKGYSVVYCPESKAVHYHERLSQGGLKEIFTKKTVRIHIFSGLKYFWKWLWQK